MSQIITVFVKTSGYCPKYIEKQEEYFKQYFKDSFKIIKCRDNKEINGYKKETKWYIVFDEGEYFDRKLMKALLAIIVSGNKQAYMCFKKDSKRMKFYVRPYIYRDFIQLHENDLNPRSGLLNCERLLDGWVYDTYNC